MTVLLFSNFAVVIGDFLAEFAGNNSGWSCRSCLQGRCEQGLKSVGHQRSRVGILDIGCSRMWSIKLKCQQGAKARLFFAESLIKGLLLALVQEEQQREQP
jgi:hypothetical protein